MHICFDIRKIQLDRLDKPVVTLGTFDGVHLGHKALIQKVVNRAKESGKKSVVVTYEPHPQMVVSPQSAPLLLTTLEEKIPLLEQVGIDELIIINFDLEFSNLTAREFIEEILIRKLNPGFLLVGYNHAFGKNREGKVENLKESSRIYNFEMEVVEPVETQEEVVSSSKIRRELTLGHFTRACQMLGHPYPIFGTVIYGSGLGKTLGYPTANLSVPDQKLLPKAGVYSGRVQVESQIYYSMVYIGTKPTLEQSRIFVEVHIFDLEKDIYDQKVGLYLEEYVREDRKFDNLEELKRQIQRDELSVKQFYHLKV